MVVSAGTVQGGSGAVGWPGESVRAGRRGELRAETRKAERPRSVEAAV